MSKAVIDGIEYEYDDSLSFRDFNGRAFRSAVFTGKTVYASCFSHERPDVRVFPDTLLGATFVQCNLDNVFLPAGNIVVGGSQRRFIEQNDRNVWLIDSNDAPTLPIDHKIFTKLRLPMPSPLDIPATRVATRIDLYAVARAK